MTSTNSITKIAVVAAALAMFASLSFAVAPAHAQSVTFTRDLTIGSTGADVTALQTWLIGKGYVIPAGATGYFGAQTQAATAAWQAAAGVTPAAGYFGAKSRAAWAMGGSMGVYPAGCTSNVGFSSTTGMSCAVSTSLPAGCTSSVGYSTTTGMSCAVSTSLPAGCTSTVGFSSTTGQSCSGGSATTVSGTGEGSIDNFKIVGALNTDLGQADSDTVYGFEFKANGSDLAVNRVDYDIVNSNNQGAIRPWAIFQTATLMNGNTTVATVDVSNQNAWSQDGTTGGNQVYRLRFDGLKDVVKLGSTADYYLVLSTQNAISDSNVGTGANYSIYLTSQGLRAVDGAGIQQYSSGTQGSTGTISVDNSSTGSVVLSLGSDNPQTQTVQGDDNSQTTGVTLLTFTLQAKDADATLYSLPVQVATTTSAASSVVRVLRLYQGSTLLDTESIAVGAGATTTFTNINHTIKEGTTESFKIVADVNSISGSFAEGAAVTVTVPGYGMDIENNNDQVSPTGAATGNQISFRSLGLSVDSSPTITENTTSGGSTNQQTGVITFTFNATAFGQDIYVSSTTNGYTTSGCTSACTNGSTFLVDGSGVATTTAASSILVSGADRSTVGNNFIIHSGQTKSISISFTKLGQNGNVSALLKTLIFGTTDATAVGGSSKSITLPSAYQSQNYFLND